MFFQLLGQGSSVFCCAVDVSCDVTAYKINVTDKKTVYYVAVLRHGIKRIEKPNLSNVFAEDSLTMVSTPSGISHVKRSSVRSSIVSQSEGTT